MLTDTETLKCRHMISIRKIPLSAFTNAPLYTAFSHPYPIRSNFNPHHINSHEPQSYFNIHNSFSDIMSV